MHCCEKSEIHDLSALSHKLHDWPFLLYLHLLVWIEHSAYNYIYRLYRDNKVLNFWNSFQCVRVRCSLLMAASCIALFAWSLIACVMFRTHGLEFHVPSPLVGLTVLCERQRTQNIPSFCPLRLGKKTVDSRLPWCGILSFIHRKTMNKDDLHTWNWSRNKYELGTAKVGQRNPI